MTKKPHGNTGKKNALKSGRTERTAVRVTPQVKDYLKRGKTSEADKIERLVLSAIYAEQEIKNPDIAKQAHWV